MYRLKRTSLRAAEKKTLAALRDVDAKARIQKYRKMHWFEKFHWFISSENYLVIGGKSAQQVRWRALHTSAENESKTKTKQKTNNRPTSTQNELLVKKYLGPNDVYVHADVHGASSVIVKNNSDKPIPPLSLSQAGVMTLCRSSAWKDKVGGCVRAALLLYDISVFSHLHPCCHPSGGGGRVLGQGRPGLQDAP